MVDSLQHVTTSLCQVNAELCCHATFTQERAHCATQSNLCSNGNSLSSCACWIVPSHAPVEIIIIMMFCCGLVVHITDTRARKVVSCTSAHITETVLAHDQHWEEQSCLTSPQLYRHSQKHRKWINHSVGHYTTGVSRCPALRGARPSPARLTFYAWCVHSNHIFLLHKSNTDDLKIVHVHHLETWSKNCTRTPFRKTFDGAGCLHFFGRKRTPFVLLQLKVVLRSAA